MNVANFDGDFTDGEIGITKEYVLFRSKEGTLDAPFLLNILTIIDITLEGLNGLSLTKRAKKLKDKKLLAKIVNKARNFRELIEDKKETIEKYLTIARFIVSSGKEISSYYNVDITTIDQRYGQMELIIDYIEQILDLSTYREEKYKGKEIFDELNIVEASKAIIELFSEKKTKDKKKYNVLMFRNLISYYLYYKQAEVIIKYSNEKALKKEGIEQNNIKMY